MKKRGLLWIFFLTAFLVGFAGCGKKAPPSLPRQSLSMLLEMEMENLADNERYQLPCYKGLDMGFEIKFFETIIFES